MLKQFALCTLVLACFGCQPGSQPHLSQADHLSNQHHVSSLSQSDVQEIAAQLSVHYTVLNNTSQVDCATQINQGKCFIAQLHYQAGKRAVPVGSKIYFSHIAPIVEENAPMVDIAHINGDLHVLTLLQPLEANSAIRVEVKAPFWHASQSDVMPNHYLVVGDSEPVIIDSTRRKFDSVTGIGYSQHAGSWEKAQQYRRREDDIFPLEDLAHIYHNSVAQWELIEAVSPLPNVQTRHDSGMTRSLNHIQFASVNLLPEMVKKQLMTLGLPLASSGELVKVLVGQAEFDSPYGYELSVTDKDISIKAATQTALAYGFVTLAQLYDSHNQQLPETHIRDYPRFAFRGVHIDIARHFLGYDAVDSLLEQMFALKLNKLHLHLSDDEGWRLAIPELPELTEVGGYRCHDLTEQSCLLPQLGSGPHKSAQGNGFLTTEQYVSLVRKAHEFGIEVIPSFDMPGHARAAVKAMEVRYNRFMAAGEPELAKAYLLTDMQDSTEYYSIQFYRDNTMNPCLDSTYHFLQTVLSSIVDMHQSAGVPLRTYHLGADETGGAWLESPICAAKGLKPEHLLGYFVDKVIDIGNEMGLTMAGWSDGMQETLANLEGKNVQVNIWAALYGTGTQTTRRFIDAGVPTILSMPDILYFDFPYRNHPLEPGYYWASKSTSTKRVFDFMPGQLARHAELWPDRLGHAYQDDEASPPDSSIEGIQAQLWSEVVPYQTNMEYLLYPRILAFAERAWSTPSWQQSTLNDSDWEAQRRQDWMRFAANLTNQHLPRLLQQGIKARVPLPGAILQQSKLHMRSPLPNLVLEYSVDGVTWQTYVSPVHVPSDVWVRTRLDNTDFTSAETRLLY